MAKKIATLKYSYKETGTNYTINMNVDLARFERQYNDAQYKLDTMVMTSMVRFMPMQSATFINVTKGMSAAIAGSGKVVAAAPPMGRFLYRGETMVDVKTGSPWARKGAKKVVFSQYRGKTGAKPKLSYSNGRQAEWFEAAKSADKKKWTRFTKRTAGGG